MQQPLPPIERFIGQIATRFECPKHFASAVQIEAAQRDMGRCIAEALGRYPPAGHRVVLANAWVRLLSQYRGRQWPVVPDVLEAVRHAAQHTVTDAPALPPPRDDRIDVLTADEYGRFLDACELIDRSAATGSPPMASIGPLKQMADTLRAKPHRIDPNAAQIRAERDKRGRKGNHGWSGKDDAA